ncbi:TVP38/TMEM64 family protein [Psychromonas ossibalaenae]|uniref:TVP38/TMEM64 family protein n=1 Tax=Psychromonas ossibalaenae TaxID=444922 RepID=UPI00037957E4|nr:VTT domain-containing protein [Psychromonas ossibalaenae]
MNAFFNILRANGTSLGFAVFLTSLPLLFSGGMSYLALEYEPLLRSFDTQQWLLLFSVSVFTMAFALTPTTLIALSSGYFLGWQALVFIVPAYLLASVLCYFAARFLDSGKFMLSLQGHSQAMLIIKRLKEQELSLVMLSKLSPILPFAVSNILLAMAGARLKLFFIGAALGMLPRTILVIYVGIQSNHLSRLLENPFSGWQQWFILLLVIISILGLGKIASKALRVEV